MFPVIQVGPFSVQASGFLLLLGLWSGLGLSSRYSRNLNVSASKLEGLVLYSILAGIIGARLFYVLRYPQIITKSPLSIFSLNPTMFDGTAGILVAVLTLLIIIQRRKMDLWQILDGITPLLSVISLSLALTHLASGSVYGIPTKMPWGITLWNEIRHPTQIYEIVLAGLVFFILWSSYRKGVDAWIPTHIQGLHFLTFAVFTAISWIIVDTFRADTVLIFNRIHLLHIFLLGTIIILIALIEQRIKVRTIDM
jgi:phosphatidylglycerol:prolipoprotein diacylglycerol transferase